MGYQALLFCPDEKLARVVSQVFSELDFAVSPVHEPFAAVKQLMAQRFDAIVVDCENEQNASLLLRSARNSTPNRNALAFAVVEGQMGVAKAYRIGANLVLTKPINLEQAKGTLRVARGLLRKGSDGSGTFASPPLTNATNPLGATSTSLSELAAQLMPASASGSRISLVADEVATEVVPPPGNRIDFAAAGPANLSSSLPVTADTETGVAPQASSQSASTILDTESASSSSSATQATVIVAAAAPQPPLSSSAAALPSGAATAPAKVITLSSSETLAAPSFRSLDDRNLNDRGFTEEQPGGSVGHKILIAAAVIVALAALSYVSNRSTGGFLTSNTQPVAAPEPKAQPASGEPTTLEESATAKPDAAKSSPENVAGETLEMLPMATPAPHVANLPAALTAESQKAHRPLVVQPHARGLSDEPAAPPPSALLISADAGAVANDKNLSGLISSTASTIAKPALSTLRISQGVTRGLLIKRVQPRYPQAALASHAEGSVQLEATISQDGSVVNPRVLSGDPLLAGAALEAVRKWRYKPYSLDGNPVEIQTQITVNFKAN